MSEPVKRSGWSLYREPSYALMIVGIFLAAFGFSSLVSGHHPVIFSVIGVVGVCLFVPMRVVRSRSGRRP